MEQPPYDVERKLSEYLVRQLSQLERRVNSIQNEIKLVSGGMRKSVNQVIGNLGAAYVTISNYQTQVYDGADGVIISLPIGSLKFTKTGNYMVNVDISVTLTQDNNSARYFYVKLHDVTDNIDIPTDSGRVFVGAYTAGGDYNVSLPVFIQQNLIGKELVLQVGGGSTFAAFNVTQVVFAAHSI